MDLQTHASVLTLALLPSLPVKDLVVHAVTLQPALCRRVRHIGAQAADAAGSFGLPLTALALKTPTACIS